MKRLLACVLLVLCTGGTGLPSNPADYDECDWHLETCWHPDEDDAVPKPLDHLERVWFWYEYSEDGRIFLDYYDLWWTKK